jgi:hypothetical protein
MPVSTISSAKMVKYVVFAVMCPDMASTRELPTPQLPTPKKLPTPQLPTPKELSTSNVPTPKKLPTPNFPTSKPNACAMPRLHADAFGSWKLRSWELRVETPPPGRRWELGVAELGVDRRLSQASLS